jgi:DMSO/TMAO reductase YedYZ molybdopterin-dependent catalytic subunit
MWSVECIGNPVGGDLIGNAVWRGTRLAPLLAQVGVQPEAIEARFYALDGYSTSVALERLAHPDTFLAYQMNGYPLAREHGYPVRMLIPGLYGQKMPKWLSRVECITEPYLGHYESTGWSNEATIQVNSKIEQPRYGEQVASGRVVVRGIAHAGLAGVESMEVGVSDSEGQNTTWLDVELLHGPTYAAWTQWRAVWEAQAGTFLVQAVATDGNGVRQTGEGRAFPNGTSGIHTVVVQVAESSS